LLGVFPLLESGTVVLSYDVCQLVPSIGCNMEAVAQDSR
jgi:hypothetical protein